MPEVKPQTVPVPAPVPAAAPVTLPPGAKPVTEPAAAPVCDETTKKEKEEFKNKVIYGPRNLSPSDTGIGAFWAMYFPHASMLMIWVSGKTKFIDGLKMNGNNADTDEPNLTGLVTLLNEIGDPDLLKAVVPPYAWKPDEKTKALNTLKARLKETTEIWEKPGFTFKVNQPCWDDITAKPKIFVNIAIEGNASLVSQGTSNADNLQVKLVKVPSPNEMGAVNARIDVAIEDKKKKNKRWKPTKEDVDRTPGAEVSATQNPSGAADKGYSEMTLGSNSLENTPSPATNRRSLLRRSIYFKTAEYTLQSPQRKALRQFEKDFREGDTDAENNTLTIVGHASTIGDTGRNNELAQKRIDSTRKYLKAIGFKRVSSAIRTVNASTAEMQKEEDRAAKNPDPEGFVEVIDSEEYQRVDLIVGSGEQQNTVAHEFGHVFGLRDEYVTKGTSFTGTGKAAGETVSHSKIAKDIKATKDNQEVQAENSDNMMSMGNEVRKQHYATFGWALNELTKKSWIIKS